MTEPTTINKTVGVRKYYRLKASEKLLQDIKETHLYLEKITLEIDLLKVDIVRTIHEVGKLNINIEEIGNLEKELAKFLDYINENLASTVLKAKNNIRVQFDSKYFEITQQKKWFDGEPKQGHTVQPSIPRHHTRPNHTTHQNLFNNVQEHTSYLPNEQFAYQQNFRQNPHDFLQNNQPHSTTNSNFALPDNDNLIPPPFPPPQNTYFEQLPTVND